MTSLDSAVPHSQRPGGSKMIADNLDFNVPCAFYKSLEKHRRIAKGFECLGAGTIKSIGQLGVRTNHADSVPAATGGSLNQKRVAHAFGALQCFGRCRNWATAPWRHRYLRLLSQLLGRDLVTYPPHHVAVGAYKNDSHLAAEVSECGVLGHKPPSN